MSIYIGNKQVQKIYRRGIEHNVRTGRRSVLSRIPPVSPYYVDFLVVAGGGGGGNASDGGGGAGGLRTSYGSTSGGGSSAESQITFNPGTQYTITVGGGGSAAVTPSYVRMPTGRGTKGIDSDILGADITTITSNGGGAGANGIYTSTADNTTVDGGSGAGGGNLSGWTLVGAGSATSNQGYTGGI